WLRMSLSGHRSYWAPLRFNVPSNGVPLPVPRMQLVAIGIPSLLIVVFAFMGFLVCGASKNMKKREYYEKSPKGVQEKRKYIQELRGSIATHALFPSNKNNTSMFVLCTIIIATCMLIMVTCTGILLFTWEQNAGFGIAMAILSIFALLLSLLYLSFTYPNGKRPKSPNFPKNRKRIAVLISCLAFMAIFSASTMAYTLDKAPAAGASMYIARDVVISTPGHSWFNVTDDKPQTGPLVVRVVGVARAPCNVQAFINFSFAVYINEVKVENLSAYDDGLSSCSGESAGPSYASNGWRVTLDNHTLGDALAIELNVTSYPSNTEQYIQINIYIGGPDANLYLASADILSMYGCVVVCSCLFLLGAGIMALVKRKNPVASTPVAGAKSIDDIADRLIQEGAITPAMADAMQNQASKPPAEEPELLGFPQEVPMGVPVEPTAISGQTAYEPSPAPSDAVAGQSVAYQVPTEFLEDNKSKAFFIAATICFVASSNVPFLLFIPAYVTQYPVVSVALLSGLFCVVGLLLAIGLLDHTYPRNVTRQHVVHKPNLKWIKTLKIVLLFTIVGLSAGTAGSVNLINQARSNFIVEGQVFTATPVHHELSVLVPRNSTDSIGIRLVGDAYADCSDVAVLNFSFAIYFNGALVQSDSEYDTDQGSCSGETETPSHATVTRRFTTTSLHEGNRVNVTVDLYPYSYNDNQTVKLFIFYQNALTDVYFAQDIMFGFFILPIVVVVLFYVLAWLYPSSYQGKKKKMSPEDTEIMRLMFGRPPPKPGDEDTIGDYIKG
nr:hypothetical protein [Candidatus Sigynarchaeota archaeon]